MVWHAYQLNPRNYLQDCILRGKMNAWRTGFPWAVIDPCIHNDTFEFDAGPEAVELFESRTGYRWNSLKDSRTANMHCPKCDVVWPVAWTDWDVDTAWSKNNNGGLRGEHDAGGFADKEFSTSCVSLTCSYNRHEITHGVLRAAKFRRDCEKLKQQDSPMQGTCLGTNGESGTTTYKLPNHLSSMTALFYLYLISSRYTGMECNFLRKSKLFSESTRQGYDILTIGLHKYLRRSRTEL